MLRGRARLLLLRGGAAAELQAAGLQSLHMRRGKATGGVMESRNIGLAIHVRTRLDLWCLLSQ